MRSGIINVLKPTGMTSHDVVSEARKILGEKKIGHTGTLDQNVAGVMVLAVGKATKLTQMLQEKKKSYRCCMTLGKKTDTSDTYGKVIADEGRVDFSEKEIKDVLNSFLGESEQIPSAYSAIKVGGERLYKMARNGRQIPDIPPRKIFIYSIETLKIENGDVTFDVSCSKGTYVRTLVEDIAKRLDTIAYVSWLIRTRLGDFGIFDSVDIHDISENDIIPLDDIYLPDVQKVILDDFMLERFVNGLAVTVTYLKDFKYSKSNLYKIYDIKGTLVSIAQTVNGDLKNKVFLYR